MSFQHLISSERGSIILVNLHETVSSGLLQTEKQDAVLQRLHKKLRKLRPPFDAPKVLRSFQKIIFDAVAGYQLAGQERPDSAAVIAAVRPFDEVQAHLKKMLVHADADQRDRIEAALAPLAPEQAMADAAEVYNEILPRMGHLSIGKFGLFWATTREEFQSVEAEARTARLAGVPSRHVFAHLVRDRLGLVQFEPSSRGDPLHLFAFETDMTLADISRTLAIKAFRPTTLDGFDNPRFRQFRPPRSTGPGGCGLTVDLGGGVFRDGAAEMVSTEISVSNVFRCRYIGKIMAPAEGTDAEFLSFLAASNQLAVVAEELDRRAGP